MSEVIFTKLTNANGLMTKTAKRAEDGTLQKVSDVEMYSGTFETISCAWESFGDVLESTEPSSCLICGVNPFGLSSGQIVLKNSGEVDPAAGKLSRSKEHFPLPEKDVLLYLDFDSIPAELSQGLGVEEAVESVMKNLFQTYPAFRLLDFWIRPSSGSYIYDVLGCLNPQDSSNSGILVKGLTGMHAYFRKPDDVTADQISQYCATAAQLAGSVSFIVTNGDHATLLPRYIVDRSSFTPSKPIFTAGLHCSPESGFEQRNREAIYWEAEDREFHPANEIQNAFAFDKAAISAGMLLMQNARDAYAAEVNLDGIRKERAEAKAAKTGLSVHVVREQMAMVEAGKLPGSGDILLDDGSWVRAWRTCLDADRFNKVTCHDPLDPDYGGGLASGGSQNKAIIYAEAFSGRASVFSWAHGGTNYQIVLDFQSIQEILGMDGANGIIDARGARVGSGLSKQDLEGALGPEWIGLLRDLSDSERNQVFDWLKKRGWFDTKGSAKVSFADAMGKQIARGAAGSESLNPQDSSSNSPQNSLQRALNELNEHYAELELGDSGEVSILRSIPTLEGEVGSGARYGHQDIASFKQVNNQKFGVWSDGKAKNVSVGDQWLQWKSRRRYCKLAFRPDIDAREIPAQVRGKDGLAFNLFEGFAVSGDAGPRPCGAESGCLSCFFDGMKPEGVLKSEAEHTHAHAVEAGQKHCICKFHLASNDGIALAIPKSTPGGITAWLRHIYECVCDSNGNDALWVAEWFLDILAHPGGRHHGKALAVYGSGFGTGKSAVAEPIKQILGSKSNCFTTANTELLVGRFNAAIEGRLLIHAEEALWREGKNVGARFKQLISGEVAEIERKGVDPYSIDNHIRMYISSNELKAVPVVPGERRVAAFKIKEHRRSDREWFGRFLCGRGEKPHDYRHWVDEARAWKFRSDLYTVPDSEGLREQKLLGMKDHPEMEFFAWSVETEFFWDAEGFPRDIVALELKQTILEQGFIDARGYMSFSKRFWSMLKTMGIENSIGKRIRVGNIVSQNIKCEVVLAEARKIWSGVLSQNTGGN